METNKNLDRIDEIFYSAIDYVEKYEKAAFLEFHKKEERRIYKKDENGILNMEPARKAAIDFAEMIETDMHAKGIITTTDYEMYGDKVNKVVGMAISSLRMEITNEFGVDPQHIRKMARGLMHILMK